MNAPVASSRTPSTGDQPGSPASGRAVTLLVPRALAGTPGIIRRAIGGRWEVEFRTPLGTPVHVVLRTRQFVLAEGEPPRP